MHGFNYDLMVLKHMGIRKLCMTIWLGNYVEWCFEILIVLDHKNGGNMMDTLFEAY